MVGKQEPCNVAEYLRTCNKKKRTIVKVKNREFKKGIAETTDSMEGLWELAKWAKNKSPLPKELPKMPLLHSNGMTTNTFEKKKEMLKEVFFPSPSNPNISDIGTVPYP